MTIGNHDCEGSIPSQYASLRRTIWYLPKRYYTVDIHIDTNTMMRLLVLVACDLVCGATPRDFRCIGEMVSQTSHASRALQYKWLDAELARPAPGGKKIWKIHYLD